MTTLGPIDRGYVIIDHDSDGVATVNVASQRGPEGFAYSFARHQNCSVVLDDEVQMIEEGGLVYSDEIVEVSRIDADMVSICAPSTL